METKKEKTITYGLGRFVIDIPASMQYRGGSYRMRNREIKEIVLQHSDSHKATQEKWEKRIQEIEKNMKPPEGKEQAIIEKKFSKHRA